MYVADSGNVPLATKGNVVGIVGGTDIDVVFDVPIFGGTTLNQRCSPNRGSRVKSIQLLNLSQPQTPHTVRNDSIPSYFKYFLENPRQLFLSGRGYVPPSPTSSPKPADGTTTPQRGLPSPSKPRSNPASPSPSPGHRNPPRERKTPDRKGTPKSPAPKAPEADPKEDRSGAE